MVLGGIHVWSVLLLRTVIAEASLWVTPENRQEAVLNLRFPIVAILLSLLFGASRVATADWPILRSAATNGIQLNEAEIGDLPSEASVMRLRLAALIEEKNWDDAISTFFKLVDRFGYLPIETESNHYLNIHSYGQILIAGLPPEARILYRDRVDAAAQDWYRSLQNVVDPTAEDSSQLDQFFCSRYGDDALLLLGDRALERGHFDQAREYWQRIDESLTATGGASLWHAYQGATAERVVKELTDKRKEKSPPNYVLVYPDSDLDLAAIRARLVLASIFQGDLTRARWELNVFEQLHPESRGALAGRDNVYADTLEQLYKQRVDTPETTQGAFVKQNEWPTFAGSPTRNRLFWRTIDFTPVSRWELTFARVMPAVELPNPDARDEKPQRQQPVEFDRHQGDLYFYPLVVRNWALLNNSSQIFALNLRDGKPAFEGSQFGQIYPRGDLVSREVKRDARNRLAADPLLPPQYSMTFFKGRLLARMGTQLTSRAVGFDAGYAGNRITCINLDREGALEWNFPSKEEEGEFDRDKWSFEGSPLADSNGVYVVMRRGAMQAVCFVACLDLQTGKLRWRQKVCQSNTPARGVRNEITHSLLTLAEGALYLNTNLGAIASLRTEDGQLRWAYRYGRLSSDVGKNLPSHFGRTLNPCVYARGIVIAAPRDSPALFALDANNGRLLWKSAPMTSYPLHLLGVGDDMLLAAGENLWWFNMITGRAQAVWPQPGNRSGPRGYGRGILAGGRVYWPTRDNIYVFDQKLVQNGQQFYPVQRGIIDLRRPDLPAGQQAESGNMVAGSGFCLIAGRDRLQAFPLVQSQADEN